MTRYANTRFDAGIFLDLRRDTGGIVAVLGTVSLALLLLELGVLGVVNALRNRQNGEGLALLRTLDNGITNAVDVVRDLRQVSAGARQRKWFCGKW